MEIINERLSDNIGYLNALRSAEVLPAVNSAPMKLSTLMRYTLIAGGLSLLVYIIHNSHGREKNKG